MVDPIQSASASTGASPAASLALTLTGTVSGNKIIIYGNSNATLTLSGITATLDVSKVASNGGYIWSATSPGGTVTVTLTPSISTTVVGVIQEWPSSVGAADKSQSASRSGSASNTQGTGTTATTAHADELIVVAGMPHSFAAASPPSGASWTSATQRVTATPTSYGTSSNNVALFVGDRTVAATGAYSDTCTWTNNSADAIGLIVTYQITGTTQNGTGSLDATATLGAGTAAVDRSSGGSLATMVALGAGTAARIVAAAGDLLAAVARTGAGVASRTATGARSILATLTGSGTVAVTPLSGAPLALSRWFTYSCSVERLTGHGVAGPLYGTPETLACMVDPGDKLVSTVTGDTVLSTARVFLPSGTAAIPPESMITLPSAFGGRRVMVINSAVYASGLGTPDHLEVSVS